MQSAKYFLPLSLSIIVWQLQLGQLDRWGQTEATAAQQLYIQLAYCHSHMVIDYMNTHIYNIYLFIVRQSPLESGVSSLTSWQKQKEIEEFKAKSGGGISFIFSFFSVGIRIAAQSTFGRIGPAADAARLQMLHQQLLQVRTQGALLVDLQLDLRHILLHLLDGGPELSQCRRHIFILEAWDQFIVVVLLLLLLEKRKRDKREDDVSVSCV